MNDQNRLLSVLIIAHDPRATGGVNNFLRIMRRELSGKVSAKRFSNGRREGERGKLKAFQRLSWDYLRFCFLVFFRKFDVLHINPTLDLSSLPRELVFPLLMSILSPKTKKIIFYRGWDWAALDFIKRSPLRLALYRFVHRQMHRVLVLSEEFRIALIDIGVPAEDIFVVSTMFESARVGEALHGKDLSAPRNTITFLSRFLPAKGGAELIEAFSRLRVDYPDLWLVMAGDGPSRSHWEKLTDELNLRDRVKFTGYVLGRTKMEYLADAEIFALPTTHPEGMPNAILEAMASGCAILSTPIAGIRDVVEHGTNGYLIQGRDSILIEIGLRTLLKNRVELRKIGEMNFQKAWKNWDSKVVSEKLLYHYKSVSALH